MDEEKRPLADWKESCLDDTNVEESSKDRNKPHTINHVIEELGFGLFQVKLIFITGLSWMVDSIEITLLSVLGPTLRCYWQLDNYEEALITTSVFVGMTIGCSFWGVVCDRFGRKKGIIISTFLVLVNAFLAASAPSYPWMLAAMFVNGFGTGGVGQSVTIYSEFVPTRSRGSGIILLQVFYVIGNIFCALLAMLVLPRFGWRWFLASAAMPILIFLSLAWWLPESPRFLLTAGRMADTEDVLTRVAANNSKPMPVGKLLPLKPNAKRGSFAELFSDRFRRTTVLLWLIWFTGVFCYYGLLMLTTGLLKRGDNICNTPNATEHKQAIGAHCVALNRGDYVDYIITALGEFPGLFNAK